MVILYADDDMDERETFAEMVREIDPEITLLQAEDGLETLQIVSNKVLPDLIFLDVNMPWLNGFETLAELRKDARLNGTKVILYSTSVDPELSGKHANLGVKVVGKPANFKEGIEILKIVIKKSK